MAEFSFEDAGGVGSKEFSFEEAGTPKAPVKREFSFEEATTPAAPEPSALMETPSIVDYPLEFGKGVGMGLTSTASSALKGVGAMQANPLPMPTERERRGMVDVSQVQQRVATPTQENPIFQAGQAVESAARSAFPAGPGFEGSYTRDIGSGFGSVGGAIALAAVNPVVAGLTFVASGSGEAADNALKAGATPDQIARATRYGTIAGATDVVDALLPILGTPAKVAGLIGKVGGKVLIGALAEGGQEGLQQTIQNLIAKGVYKPDQDIGEDVARSALIGAIVGGAVKPIVDREAPATTPTEQQINVVHAGLINSILPTADPSLAANAPPTVTPQPIVQPPMQPELSPLEQLLQDLPKTPTEAHLRESSPFSSGADSSLAEAAPLIMTPQERNPLRTERLNPAPDPDLELDPNEPRLSAATAQRFIDFAAGKENEAQLLEQRIRQVVYDRSLRAKAGDDIESEAFAGIRNELAALRSRLREVSDPERLNVSKLTPEAAARRKELEAGIDSLLRNTRQEQLERIIKGVIRVGAGPEAAGRSAVLPSIQSRAAGPGWGGSQTGVVNVLGAYSPSAERQGLFNLIRVSLAHGPRTAINTAFHESWHAIEGTLTREEINILRRDTEQWRRFITERNPVEARLYAAAEPEEIWAEAAAFTASDKLFEKVGYISPESKTIMQHIHELLDRIRSYMQGHGFRTSADVFEAYYSGEMASRRQGLPTDMLERWWAREAGTTKAQIAEQASKLDRNSSRNAAVMRSVDPEFGPVPAQIETIPLHSLVGNLYSMAHGAPAPVQQALAMADNMAKRHKWAWGLDRLVDLNPRFGPLLRYAERIREMRTDAAKIQDFALRIAKDWRRLGRQMENLGALLDDVSNMTYRSPSEKQRGIARHPTQQEFNALVQQHKVSAEALAIFNRQKQFFERFLQLVTDNAIAEARRTITDPVALMNKITELQAKQANLLSKPYFPFLRYGRHYVMVKDAAGKVVDFRTFERKGFRTAEMVQGAALKQISKILPAGHTATKGVLPEDAAPFIGLPPELIESIQRTLAAMPNAAGQAPGLTAQQIAAIEQLRFAMTPGTSFAHRFQNKDYTPGYSNDFLRSFSRYAFNGARYYSRVKYAWALRKEIAEAERLGKIGNDNKIGSIAQYMSDHLYHTVLDSKGDFGAVKGAIFLWMFGYSAAGATLNMSQVPMVTYPWLAAKFGGIGIGDARASKAIVKAMTQINNFQRKGAYTNHTQFEMKAIDYGIKSGRITEAMASELAGLAQGNTLLGSGNTKIQRFAQKVLELGTKPFEMIEQFNRRVTYRAALELAQKLPNSKATREAMNKYADEYAQLVQSNTFTPSEAQAVVTAVHAVEQTQFVYARENRPRFMRGRLAGTVFVFQTYTNNILQLMGANYGSVMPRMLIMLLGAAGIMGLPGAEDAEEIASFLGKFLFGKDFNLKRVLRENLTELLGDKADVVLHGFARRGFGLPALLDTLGEAPGRGLGSGHSQNVPVPVLDRSKALGMGRILPIQPGSLLDPLDMDKSISQETQRASGAAWGVGFNLFRALHDASMDWSDFKRWEKAMPRALGSVSKAWRTFEEERVRGRGRPNSAPSIIDYDIRDPEHMAEIFAMGLGYQPERLTRKWDEILMKAEVIKRLETEQKLAIANRYEAQKGGVPEEIDRSNEAIRRYNDSLPEWGRGYKIGADTLIKSFEARERDRVAKEAGVSVQRRNRPIDDYMRQLFPDATDVQRR